MSLYAWPNWSAWMRPAALISAVLFGAISGSTLAVETHKSPYAVWATDGVLIVGPPLQLRSPSEIEELWGRRWLGPYGSRMSDTRGFPLLRPDATDEDIKAARDFARAEMLAPIAFMGSVGEGVDYGDFSDAQKAGFSHSWDVLPTALDILAATGTADDAQFLVDVVVGLQDSPMLGVLAEEFAIASVQISLRSGDVANSPAARSWQGLASTQAPLAWTSLGIALGRVGYQPAISDLIQHLAVERRPVGIGASGEAFKIITMSENPAVLALAVDLVAGYDAWAQQDLLGQEAPRLVAGINVIANFDTAFGYAAAFLPESGRHTLAIGIPASGIVNGAYFETPADLAALALGVLSGEYGGMDNEPVMRLACRIYGDVSVDARAAAELHYTDLLLELATHFGSAYPGVDARTYNAVGKSRCAPNSVAVSFLKTPEKNSPQYYPAWMQYGFREASHFLPDFVENPGAPLSLTGVLAGYDDVSISELLDDSGLSGRHGVVAYRHYRSVIDSSGLGASAFVGQNDERFFLESLLPRDRFLLYLGAKISLAPRVANDRVLFGLSLDLAPGDLGALAGAINQTGEIMQRALADSGRALIDKVVLRYQGGATELAFVQTTEGGTHVFEVPEPVASNVNLYVDVYFKGSGQFWRQSFPLFASPLGYEHIQKFGRLAIF